MSKRKRRKRPGSRLAKEVEKIKQHPLFQELKKQFSTSIDRPELFLKRAELTDRLCREGHFSQRAVAAALGVDQGTIGRDCDLARLSDADKEEFRKGKSLTAVLKAARPKSPGPERPLSDKRSANSIPPEPQVEEASASSTGRVQRPVDMRSRQEIIRDLSIEIVRWLWSEGVTPNEAIEILTSGIRELFHRHRQGEFRDQRVSADPPQTVIARTKPNSDPSLSKCDYYCSWLLNWSPALQPNWDILDSAMRQARTFFENEPRPKGAYGTKKWQSVQESLNQQRDLNQLIREFGPELIKHPDSPWTSPRLPTQAEAEQQAKAELAVRNRKRAEEVRRLMGWPAPPNPTAESQDVP